MAAFEGPGQCKTYLRGEAQVVVHLPATHPHCQYCPHIAYQQPYDRYHCRITGEWIMNYKKERGQECPFKWETDDETH